jgi:hypothetical protein
MARILEPTDSVQERKANKMVPVKLDPVKPETLSNNSFEG